MSSKYSYRDVNLAIVEIETDIKIRDSIPYRFNAAHTLIQEMNNDLYVKCDTVATMLKDIVNNGISEDTPF